MPAPPREKQHVIIIDDDPISNLLTEEKIKTVHNKECIHSFVNPEFGLERINTLLSKNINESIILLLDINMPNINGWDALDKLKAMFEDLNTKSVRIYMLSSSIDMNDKIKAYNNPLVSGYFEKPLSVRDFMDLIFKNNYL